MHLFERYKVGKTIRKINFTLFWFPRQVWKFRRDRILFSYYPDAKKDHVILPYCKCHIKIEGPPGMEVLFFWVNYILYQIEFRILILTFSIKTQDSYPKKGFGVINKPRGWLTWEGVFQMTVLLYKLYLIKVTTMGEGIKNTYKSDHVVYGWPLFEFTLSNHSFK